MRIGVGIPNFGMALESLDAREMARAVEQAGFDGLWLTDHVLVPREIGSRYPYGTADAFHAPAGGHWFEAVTTLGYLAAATEKVQLGIGVCIPALRDPRVLSQQIATLDRLCGGRVVLGAGTGWLTEEFAALEVPTEGRGRRLEACIDVMRACWTGEPPSGTYGPYTLLEGLLCRPTPAQERVPILLAGIGDRALRRVVTHGDGWYGAVGAGQEPSGHEIARVRAQLLGHCDRLGRDPAELTLGLRIAVSARDLDATRVQDQLLELADAGLDVLTIDFGWRSISAGRAALEALAATVGAVRGDKATVGEP